MRSTVRVAAVVLSLVLSGCATGGDPVIGAPSVPPTSAGGVPTGDTGGGAGGTCVPTFPANTEADTETGSGQILGLRSARVAAQNGYDRVVFELANKGAPGWEVAYVDAPRSDGSGNPVAVKGEFFLQVLVRHVGTPGDTGVPEPAVRRLTPTGTLDVTEVVLDGVFEGQYTAFLGLDSERPFRVTRLSSPPRVIVDVRHC